MPQNNKKEHGSEMSVIISNIEKVKKLKASKVKKPSTSLKPLKIKPNDDDTPLKAEIVRRINDADLTYADLYKYCTALKNGDISEGQKFGYNLISGLKNRRSFMDSTLSILADFLGLDILFVNRADIESVESGEDSNNIELM